MCFFLFFVCVHRWYDWDAVKGTGDDKVSLKLFEKDFNKLEDVGQQLALTFNHEGSVLATGGEVRIIFQYISAV